MKKKLLAVIFAVALCAGLLVPASAAGQTFTDVPSTHWAYESIKYAVEKGYFQGTGANIFSPEWPLSNGMIWTLLYRIDGNMDTSVPGEVWYAAGQKWASENGIMLDAEPFAGVPRQDFAEMLYLFAQRQKKDTSIDRTVMSKFEDQGAVDSYAADGVAWAVTHGIISGTTNMTLSPHAALTRAQAAAMLMRYDEVGEGTGEGTLSTYTPTFRFTSAGKSEIEPGEWTSAYVYKGENSGVTYTFSSSDPSVAVVYHEKEISPYTCNIMGIQAGTVTITAKGSDGYVGTLMVTVKAGAETLIQGTTDYTTRVCVIDGPPPFRGDTIEVGESAFIAVDSMPYGANVEAGVTYTATSSDPSVATVNKTFIYSTQEVNFSVKGQKAGTVKITIIGSDGFVGTATITVTGAEGTVPTQPSTGETEPEPTTPIESDYISEVVRLVNKERAKQGISPLQTNDTINGAAQVRANELSILLDHTRPDGSSCFTALEDAGIRYWTAGENIAAGYPTPEQVVNGWTNSEGHRTNILNKNFTTIGVGHTGRYWVQLFIG